MVRAYFDRIILFPHLSSFWGFFHLLTKSVQCEFKTSFLSKLMADRMRAAKKVCVRHNISVMQLFCV